MYRYCRNCRTENPIDAVTCLECGMGMTGAPVGRDGVALEDSIERAASLILTTGFEVQGRPLGEYLGIVASEVVMGTGPIVEFMGGFADLFGRRSGAFEGKLEQAREACLDKLKGKAALVGADAVIAVDIDYMNVASNMLMVVATGTAVTLLDG